MNKDDALAYWMGTDHEVFVAEEDGELSHVFSEGESEGRRSARGELRLCDGRSGSGTRTRADDVPPFDRTRERTRVSRDAVQFCGATNANAVRLWQSCGFQVVGRLPDAFLHPRLGYVDALVMYRSLKEAA